MSDMLKYAELLRKNAATLRRIASIPTSLSPKLIEIAEHEEGQAVRIEAAAKGQPVS
jgi:hypothetical protein